MSNFLPYGRQQIIEEDIESVLSILKSDFLTQGPCVNSFEKLISSLTHSQYAVAVNSATSALHLACLALDVKKGDEVWTVPNTFVASANCALYCDAKVDFVDIDPLSWCMSPEALEKKIKDCLSKSKKLPKVIIPVHLAGQPCEMEKIKQIADEYNIKIIEDASHAIGGSYKGEPIGSCKYSDITVFSFHPVKIITTGEGGAAVCNDLKIATRMSLLRSHGITRDINLMENPSDNPWYYEQIELGYNFRMSDIHAALGISQIKRIKDFLKIRNQIATKYNRALQNINLKKQQLYADTYSSRHLYIIRIDEKLHKEFMTDARKKGIGVNLHYLPLHLHPYYRKLGFSEGAFPESEQYAKEAVSLPIFVEMKNEDQNRVIDFVVNYL